MDHGFRYLEGIFQEDREFVPKVIAYAERISAVKRVIYNYFYRIDSVCMSKNDEKRIKDGLFIASHLNQMFKQNTEFYMGFFNNYISESVYGLMVIGAYSDSSLRALMNTQEIDLDFINDLHYQRIDHNIGLWLIKHKCYELFTLIYKIRAHLNIKS